MPIYKILPMDERGKFLLGRDFIVADDEAALALAARMMDATGGVAEVRFGQKMVGRVSGAVDVSRRLEGV